MESLQTSRTKSQMYPRSRKTVTRTSATIGPMIYRVIYAINGVVQGVGFRPHAYRIANELGVSGNIKNTTGSVRLTIEGSKPEILSFMDRLTTLPVGARIDSITELSRQTITDTERLADFTIIMSDNSDSATAVLPPDTAMCSDCRREIHDPANRRYRHPFATCTICGPRYSITKRVPFDRENTTMDIFEMCSDCEKEYANPNDRRFHAQTIACNRCGPILRLLDEHLKEVDGDPIRQTQALLRTGNIVAVKGIGGYLLAADPFDLHTVERLRARKNRPNKPFALMAKDVNVIRRYAKVSEQEEAMLISPEAPIVILNRIDTADNTMPHNILAPDTDTIGFMLPYSPLHELILDGIDLLIMTSGNKHAEPICLTNDQAFSKLAEIADYYLVHDREISYRSDDSLCISIAGNRQIWRNARGYTPQTIQTRHKPKRCVLALGAEIKNTVSLSLEDSIITSPHIGDMETPEAIESFEKIATTFPMFYNRTPDAIAIDLHPDMHVSVIGRRIAKKAGIPICEVQHHHAHGAALMLEHSIDSMLALVFDGTGMGNDGSIWGAELLHITPDGFTRLATFAPAILPGGDLAIAEPWRQLLGRLHQYGIEVSPDYPGLKEYAINSTPTMKTVMEQCRKGINTPLSHAAGRVFDSVSCALGASGARITYEGQAAIRLETLAMQSKNSEIPKVPVEMKTSMSKVSDFKFQVSSFELLQADWKPFFEQLPMLCSKYDRSDVAMIFHRSVAVCAMQMIEYGIAKTGEKNIGISGGVFMNRILNSLLLSDASQKGIRIHTHSILPPNDGCISAGQAVIASGSS